MVTPKCESKQEKVQLHIQVLESLEEKYSDFWAAFRRKEFELIARLFVRLKYEYVYKKDPALVQCYRVNWVSNYS